MFINNSLKRRAVFALFLVILSETTITQGWNVSCSAPEAVVGSEAILTCSFGDDVTSASPKPSVKVRRVRKDFNNVRDTILECDWHHNSLKCRPVKDGYYFDMAVTDHLTIRIPHVTTAFAGRYVCMLVPSEDDIPQPCNLSVTEKAVLTTEYTSPAHFTSQQSTTPRTKNSSNERTTVVEDTKTVIILAVALAVVVVVLILGMAYACRQRIQRKWRDCFPVTERPTVPSDASQVETESPRRQSLIELTSPAAEDTEPMQAREAEACNHSDDEPDQPLLSATPPVVDWKHQTENSDQVDSSCNPVVEGSSSSEHNSISDSHEHTVGAAGAVPGGSGDGFMDKINRAMGGLYTFLRESCEDLLRSDQGQK